MEKSSELSIPGNSSAALVQLAEHTSRYVEAGLSGAANTVKAYAGDWKRFGLWCAEHGLEPLPASVETLAGFVTHLAETDKKVATIQRHCAAVAKAHVLRGLDSPTDDKKFKVLMEGIARVKGVRQKQAPAFTLANFKRTVKSIDAKTLAVRAPKTDLAVLVPTAAQARGLVGLFAGHLAFPLLFPGRVKVVAHGAYRFARRVVVSDAGVGNFFQRFGPFPVAVEIHRVGRGQTHGRRLGPLSQRRDAYNKE